MRTIFSSEGQGMAGSGRIGRFGTQQSSFFLSLLFFVLASFPAAAAAEPSEPLLAYGARIAGDNARTRIVIDFDRELKVSVHYVADPVRVIVDLPRTAFGFAADDLAPRGLFTDIRYGTMDEHSARIVLTASRPVRLAMAEVQADEGGKGYRLVLDAETVTEDGFGKLLQAQDWQDTLATAEAASAALSEDGAPDSRFVIAVDAGHGGIDAGAVGSDSKIEEKTVTLSFARTFVERLNREPGIEAFLTRDKDQFLSLSERVQIARGRHANLLISLHADTLRQRNIRGATVYTISDTASDSLAADLAKRENLSDEIAGVALSSEPAAVADILLDLTRRETQAFSIAMARAVVSSFEGQVSLINNPHRYAGFRVLQAPDMPSILLELGFLSNLEDEKLLVDEKWREKVADLLTAAARRYRERTVSGGG